MKKKHIFGRLPNIAFICGGNDLDSMKNQFLEYVKSEYKHVFISCKKTTNIFSDERIILAEKVEDFWDKCLKTESSGYNNLLEFEMDIAELASVIPIFLESPGAMIETGAFFCNPKLRKKLLIIVKKDYFNNDSFIQRAILEDPFLSGKVIYYDDSALDRNQKIFEIIFSFRNQIGHLIDTKEDNQTALYFFLLKLLCEWKTEDEIKRALQNNYKFKKYSNKIGDHLKILTALGLILEEPDFSERKFLSLIREDCVVSDISSSHRNVSHVFNQVKEKVESNLILLKYMKQFADKEHFSYSYHKPPLRGYKKPKQQLNVLQDILKTRVLSDNYMFPIHESATAYARNKGIKMNAVQHSKNRFILKLDFKHFFSSIKRSDFLNYLKSKNFKGEYNDFICDIAFRDDSISEKKFSLPIGASTSPSISNVLLFAFDKEIAEYSRSLRITYTRYADDLTFSHNEPNKLSGVENKVLAVLQKIPFPLNLKINARKTVHMSKKGQRKVTGLYITPQGNISIGRNRKTYIKKLLRDYEKGKHKEKEQHIQGYLCFIKNVDKKFWNQLHNKYIKKNSCDKKNLFKLYEFYVLFYNNELARKRRAEEIY